MYIVLKLLNTFKIYRCDFSIFLIFSFFHFVSPFVSPLCFTVVLPRSTTPVSGSKSSGQPLSGRSPRAWVEVLEPGSKSSSFNIIFIFSFFSVFYFYFFKFFSVFIFSFFMCFLIFIFYFFIIVSMFFSIVFQFCHCFLV